MRKLLLNAMIVFVLGYVANAQIKMVGEDYIDSLSATKNYFERDIDFDSLFPAVSPQVIRDRLNFCFDEDIMNINLSGDTIYLFSIYEMKNDEFAIDNVGKVTPTKTIPIGYYIISGYVICIENENQARESAGLNACAYEHEYDFNIKNLKKEILYGRVKLGRFSSGITQYIRYVTLTPIDTINKDNNTPVTYYCRNKHEGVFECDKNIQLRFYNEARKFIGKEMTIGFFTWDSFAKKETIVDDFTGDPVKLSDNSYVVKDIVMKGTSLYIVLLGEKTGTFAHKIEMIRYAYDKTDLIGINSDNDPSMCDIACFHEYVNYPDQIYIVCVNDIMTLYNRPKIIAAERQKEIQLKKQQIEKKKSEQNDILRRKMIEKYGEEVGNLIGNRQVAVGMTYEMVVDAWGRPINTYRTTTEYGQSEVWCYNYKTRVYFFDGKVVQIDD